MNQVSTFFPGGVPKSKVSRLPPLVSEPSFTPDPVWDLDKIYETQDEHETGHFYNSALLAQWMKRDGRLSSVLSTRIEAVFGLPFGAEPPSEEPLRLEKKIAKNFEKQWTSILSEKAAKEILEWVILMGFCFGQLSWKDLGPSESARWQPHVTPWSPQWFRYNQYRSLWQVQTRHGLQDIHPGDGRWVLFSSRESQPWMSGAVLSLAIPVLVRSWSWKDWSNFNETLGKAFLKATVPAWAEALVDDAVSGTPSKQTFLSNVSGLGRETNVLLCEEDSQGKKFDATYEALDGKRSYEAFEKVRQAADTEITIRIKGQNLTTEVGKNGARSAVESHGDVDQNLLESDCELLSSDSREGVGKPWARVNYGDEDLAPWAQWDPTPPEDEQTKAETLDKLSTAVPLLDTQLVKHGKQIDLPVLLAGLKVPLKDLVKPEMPAPISPAVQRLRTWAASAPADARVMIALYPSPEIQSKLAIEGGEPKEELHVTLAYLGRVSEIGAEVLEELALTVRHFAERYARLEGTIGGFGRFSASETSDGKDVIYASIDVPNLASFREKLVMEIEDIAPAKREHGFTPHMTLAYVGAFEESPVDRLEPVEVSFAALELVIEGQRQAFPLKGQRTFSSVVPFRVKMRGAR